MQEENKESAKKVIEAILARYKIRKKTDLAKILDVSPNTISTWISRNSINAGIVCRVFNELDYDWVRTGEGEMLRSKLPREGLNDASPPLSWIVEWLWQVYRRPEAGMQLYERMKDCFPEFDEFCKKKREGALCED